MLALARLWELLFRWPRGICYFSTLALPDDWRLPNCRVRKPLLFTGRRCRSTRLPP
jgi:hypothetical protein